MIRVLQNPFTNIFLIAFVFLFSNCSRQIYVLKTDGFIIKSGQTVFITGNDSIKCASHYSPSWQLLFVDTLSANKSARDFDLKKILSDNFNKKGITVTDNANSADLTLDYQDYWLCRKKQKLALLALKITDNNDKTQGALIIDKAYDFAKFDYDREFEKVVVKVLDPNSKTYKIDNKDLLNFPKINDIPSFSQIQFGVSFGFSTGTLPHSELKEKYPDYYNKLYLYSVGADIDFYGDVYPNSIGPLGVGLKSIYYFGNHSEQNVNQFNDENDVIATGQLADDIGIFFIAPSIIFRLPFYSYTILSVIKLSPGYLNYRNNAIRFDETVNYKGNTFAFGLSIGADFRLSQKFNMGFEARMLFAGFNKMHINGLKTDLDTKEKLNRFGLAIVLKFN